MRKYTLVAFSVILVLFAASVYATAGRESVIAEEEVITVTTVRESARDVRLPEGENWDDNAIYDLYEEVLGIRIENLWVVNTTQYDTRLQMSIAAGDIPDFFRVKRATNAFPQLLQADLLADLTETWDQTASQQLKDFVTADGGLQFSLGQVGGKQMAIPETGNFMGGIQNLWVRSDWLEQIGESPPKSMKDVLRISAAFTSGDPNGNGKQDEFGLGTVQDFLTNAVYGLQGFFNGYDAYPGIWVVRSGRLEYGSIQPETRTALEVLSRMFANGEIDPEFGLKDPLLENELAVNDQLGMVYGAWWMASWPLRYAAMQDDKAVQKWEPFILPSETASMPAKTQLGVGFDAYWVVSADSAHPEAMIKLMDTRIISYSDPALDESLIITYGSWREETDPTNQNWKLNPVQLYPQFDADKSGAFIKALQERNRSIIEEYNDPTLVQQYDDVVAYEESGEGPWHNWVVNKVGGSAHSMLIHFEAGRFQTDAYYGPPTPTMGTRGATLQSRENEIFTRILMGEADISEFDTFAEEWLDIGGADITEEVNNWYKNLQ